MALCKPTDHLLPPQRVAGSRTPYLDRTVLVQKYGGTSLGSAASLRQVAEIVKLLEAADVALRPGVPSDAYESIVSGIRDFHLGEARAALTDDVAYQEIATELYQECAQLRIFLEAARVIGEMSTRSMDAVIGVGEKLACHLFAAILRSLVWPSFKLQVVPVNCPKHMAVASAARTKPALELTKCWGLVDPKRRNRVQVERAIHGRLVNVDVQGVNALMINLCRVIAEPFTDHALDTRFYDHVRDSIVARVHDACRNHREVVPVITGYFGFVPGGIVRSIGRGYSDFTASLVAAGFGARELQIWKQVDGIFSADPTKVPGARLLPSITPTEAAELTYYGAEVIHPFTMEQVINASVPIRIKNTHKPEDNGTVIHPDLSSRLISPDPEPASPKNEYVNGYNDVNSTAPHDGLSCFPPLHKSGTPVRMAVSKSRKRPRTAEDALKRPTAATVKAPVWVVNIRSNRKSLAHDFLGGIFSILNRHGIIVDLISTSEVMVSMAINPVKDRDLRLAIEELSSLGTVSVLLDMAIVSLVGRHMQCAVGVAAQMFSALAQEGINIEMISQGASEINISCVIDSESANKALIAVHDRLILGDQANDANDTDQG